jgi:hypothetical protein
MKKNILVFLTILAGPLCGIANEIICYETTSQKAAMIFSSQNPIPDFSFESFKIHSAYGAVLINEKDFGSHFISVKNAGSYLHFEIKIQNDSGQPNAYVHLSFNKSGIFNGYQQYYKPSYEQQTIEMLSCQMTSSMLPGIIPLGGICCSKAASNATGCDPGC